MLKPEILMTGTFDTATSLPFIDASAKVLALNVSPLHDRDITQQALNQGLIQSEGKTPEATLNAVKRQKSNIQRTVLDALRGSLYRFQAVRGTIITTAQTEEGEDS